MKKILKNKIRLTFNDTKLSADEYIKFLDEYMRFLNYPVRKNKIKGKIFFIQSIYIFIENDGSIEAQRNL